MTYKLPESRYAVTGDVKDHNTFTSDQMHAHYRDALEMAAKFCEANQVTRSPREGRMFMEFEKDDGGIHEGMDYAAALRKLKESIK